ncbi:hypothetical protein ACFC0N_26835 [Streptomyces zaomyceticus]|uniref:hypothetical protein n=1 Tax=Streptomyces zaomyceticus TaxID=68286 RepID=UPI0035E1192A
MRHGGLPRMWWDGGRQRARRMPGGGDATVVDVRANAEERRSAGARASGAPGRRGERDGRDADEGRDDGLGVGRLTRPVVVGAPSVLGR